ncbi:hypothetical protein BGAFAR04_E0034 (plasmid) [Borreliella garinii Far04]|nr:hypothetical protein BGAFAR04_E0034 [Borreliella garinii Far04]
MTFSYFEILIKIVKSFKPINFIICTVFNFLQNLMHSLKRISKLELLAIFFV